MKKIIKQKERELRKLEKEPTPCRDRHEVARLKQEIENLKRKVKLS